MLTYSKYLILYPINPAEEGAIIDGFDGDKFIYFKVYNDKKEIIDEYDFIRIECPVRTDVIEFQGKWCTRFFPDFYNASLPLIYSQHNHMIITKEQIKDYDMQGDEDCE